MGIVNGESEGAEFQLIYSDTPGIIVPKYELHRSMMSFVMGSLEDADVILFVTDIFEQYDEDDVLEKLQRIREANVLILINKTDLATNEQVNEKIIYWKEKFPLAEVILPISALKQQGTDKLLELIVKSLPVHPPYFPKDELTDKPERFFAAEIIREKIFLNYKKEIPYSSEVVVIQFKETNDIIKISAEIYVERVSQRAILIGHKGESLKKVGIAAREEMEKFFAKKVFLETFVKVEPDWRSKERKLREFGYNLD